MKTPQADEAGGEQPRGRFRRAAKVANTVLVPKGVGLAVGQFGKSKKNLTEALAAARETRKRLLADSKLPIKTVIMKDGTELEMPQDPSERFEFLYRVMEWNPEYHTSQLRAVRGAKFASIVTTVASFLLVCYMIFVVPMWLALILIPTSLTVLAVGAAATFRWALIEYHYAKRSLINYKTFLVQPDFFRWIFC
jgi:hypothetical protein